MFAPMTESWEEHWATPVHNKPTDFVKVAKCPVKTNTQPEMSKTVLRNIFTVWHIKEPSWLVLQCEYNERDFCVLSPESCLRRLTCPCKWLKGDWRKTERQVDGYTCVARKQKLHFTDHFPLSFFICVYCSWSSIYVLLEWPWLNSR